MGRAPLTHVSRKRVRMVAFLLTMNAIVLWYYVAGGRYQSTVEILAGVASFALTPTAHSAWVLARHKWLLASAAVLTVLGWVLSLDARDNPVLMIGAVVVFALGFGSVVRYASTTLGRRNWVFNVVVLTATLFAGWAVIFAIAILPQNALLVSGAAYSPVEIEELFGVFSVGNNYITLTYFLTLPMAAAASALSDVRSGRSRYLLVAAVVCVTLSILFGRRSPVIAAGASWLVLGILGRSYGISWRRFALWLAAVFVAIAGTAIWAADDQVGKGIVGDFGERVSVTSDDPRWFLSQKGLAALSVAPFGGGRRVFKSIQSESAFAHNAIIDVGLDLGVIGALVFAIFLGQIAWGALARMPSRRYPLDGLELCLIAVVLSHLLVLMQEPFVNARLVVAVWASVLLNCVGRQTRRFSTREGFLEAGSSNRGGATTLTDDS